MNEWICQTQWFIVARGSEREHISKPFSYFQNGLWKSTAWLNPNKWLLLPFHMAQKPNPRTTWATNVDSDWDHHSMCQTLLTTHKTHWLQLYEVKTPQKGEMWRRCLQSFLLKKSLSIWASNAKIKPIDRRERIGSLLLSQGPSGTALFCFSTTDPCSLLCWPVMESVEWKKNSCDDRGPSLEEFSLPCFPLISRFVCTVFPGGFIARCL